jgi:hypothetical protein
LFDYESFGFLHFFSSIRIGTRLGLGLGTKIGVRVARSLARVVGVLLGLIMCGLLGLQGLYGLILWVVCRVLLWVVALGSCGCS